MQKIEANSARIVRNIKANMKAEGFSISSATNNDCIAIAAGKASADQLVKARIAARGFVDERACPNHPL